MNQMSWRNEDQFDNFIFSPDVTYSYGWNFIELRKKRDNNANSYEYKISKDAVLTADENTTNSANIVTPKPPGEWIDLTLEKKELYLYLECIFSIESRNSITNRPQKYKISSAKLITAEKLPDNFSGTYQVKQDNFGYSYYEITLGRSLICIFNKNDFPTTLIVCDAIRLRTVSLNGFDKPII